MKTVSRIKLCLLFIEQLRIWESVVNTTFASLSQAFMMELRDAEREITILVISNFLSRGGNPQKVSFVCGLQIKCFLTQKLLEVIKLLKCIT